MKRAAAGIFLILIAACWLVSCGGGSGSSTSGSLGSSSGLSFRAFISNNFAGQLNIVDARLDQLNPHSINVGSQPTVMAITPDLTTTLVFNSSGHSFSIIDNATEQQTGTIGIADFTDSFIPSNDSARLFVAVPNEGVLGQPNGAVEVLNIGGAFRITSIPVPAAHHLSLSNDGNHLLVFSDNSNSVTIIDTTKINTGGAVTVVPGFDRPVAGAFSSDDTQAFILDCGPECGGSKAGVTVLNMTNATVGTTVPVQAATVGLLNGTTLYVAGTPGGVASQGTFQTVDTGSLTASAAIAISNGYHNSMAITNDFVWVGARTCTNLTVGCLSIVNTTSNTAAEDTPHGDVTGMQPITNRNIIYIVEGGELRIFDTTTGKLGPTQLDIVGKAWDVKQVDKQP